GHKVGYSEDSFTAAEFDLTEHVRIGANTVAVEVYRWSDGSWLECQDMIDLSGIFREVYLCAAPQVHVRDIRVRTVLDEQYRDATLNMQIAVANAGQNSGTRRTVDAMLYDAAEQPVWSRPERIPIDTGQQREVSAERDVP